MEFSPLHDVVLELYKAKMINANDKAPLCFNGRSKRLGSSEHLGSIIDFYRHDDRNNSGVCVTFYNKVTNEESTHCSNNANTYYIKPANCLYNKGGMRLVNRRITKRLKRSARRRTRQRGGAHCRVKVGNTTMEGDSEEMCKTLRKLANSSPNKTHKTHNNTHSTINPLHVALGRR